jgi:hypothetical protein
MNRIFIIFLNFTQGANSVMDYHDRSLPKMVIDLFPDIGATETGFKGTQTATIK